ncbi:hypothetical protein V6N13_026485 [Hibiscus sabdariffa]
MTDNSDSSSAFRPTTFPSTSANPPPRFIMGLLSVQPTPIMDVDKGSSGEENFLSQSECLERPRMNVAFGVSFVQSNPSSFDNVVSSETCTEISTGLLSQASRKQ